MIRYRPCCGWADWLTHAWVGERFRPVMENTGLIIFLSALFTCWAFPSSTGKLSPELTPLSAGCLGLGTISVFGIGKWLPQDAPVASEPTPDLDGGHLGIMVGELAGPNDHRGRSRSPTRLKRTSGCCSS